MKTMKLVDLAKTIRSKNAGTDRITFDIIFREPETYFMVKNSGVLSRKTVCELFGIKERGVLKEGYFADMVIFDPENIREVGVFGDPHHYPEGIDAVLVNDQVVIDHGNHTGNLPGEILRK